MTGRFFLALTAMLGLAALALLFWKGQRETKRSAMATGQTAVEPVPEFVAGIDGRRAVEAASPPLEGPAIRVLVRDLEGRPISGARVRSKDDPQVEVMTDETGACALRFPRREWLSLQATAGGFLGVEDKIRCTEEITVQLPRACTLIGHVLDADTREPVAGAQVSPLTDRRWTPEWVGGESDESGAFRLEHVPATKSLMMSARASGYSDLNYPLDLSSAGDFVSIELLMVPTARLVVVVLEHPSGMPIAQASVNGMATDDSGRVSFDADQGSNGAIKVFTEAAGHCSLSGSLRREAVGSEPLVLRLPLLGRFEGIVRDERGTSVSGAKLVFEEYFFLKPNSPDEA